MGLRTNFQLQPLTARRTSLASHWVLCTTDQTCDRPHPGSVFAGSHGLATVHARLQVGGGVLPTLHAEEGQCGRCLGFRDKGTGLDSHPGPQQDIQRKTGKETEEGPDTPEGGRNRPIPPLDAVVLHAPGDPTDSVEREDRDQEEPLRAARDDVEYLHVAAGAIAGWRRG